MSSWIYLFSKFTPEALLFEALLISLLCASYTAFWVLRKRKLGSVDAQVPSGLVKAYLSELIVDAEQMRTQLFGLLSATGMGTADAHRAAFANPMAGMPAAGAGPALPAGVKLDPAVQQKLGFLEAKMVEQAKVMETIVIEKQKIEKELVAAKAASGGKAGPAAPGDSAAIAKLEEKVKTLEAKLAEYSVIEDDLANLKRLQQENAQLRASLGGAAPPPIAEAAAAPAPEQAPPAEPVAAAPAPSEPEPPVAAAAPAAPEGNFDGLVDQVEKSLQNPATPPEPQVAAAEPAAPEAAEPPPAEAPAGASVAAAAAPASPSTPEAAPITMDKTDADLVAEFEKMLNG